LHFSFSLFSSFVLFHFVIFFVSLFFLLSFVLITLISFILSFIFFSLFTSMFPAVSFPSLFALPFVPSGHNNSGLSLRYGTNMSDNFQ
jgi:hypothetical protein